MSQPKVTLQLRNQCMWSPSFEAKYIYLRPNIYIWSQIYVPEAWGSGAPRVAGSRISFPFPLAPALFSQAGMKFEESLNIRLRDSEGVDSAGKSIFFHEICVFFFCFSAFSSCWCFRSVYLKKFILWVAILELRESVLHSVVAKVPLCQGGLLEMGELKQEIVNIGI